MPVLRRFTLQLIIIVLAAFAPLLVPESASGHASLLRSDPHASSSLLTSPARVRLWFSEPVEHRFSGIEVYDVNRGRVDTGDFRLEGADGKSASTGLKTLVDGTYTVSWHNLSKVDGHSLAGSFAFNVGDAPAPVGGIASTTTEASGSGVPVVPSALVRALNFLAMATLVGAFGFRTLVLMPALRASNTSFKRELAPALAGGVGRVWSESSPNTHLETGSLMRARAPGTARVALGLLVVGALLSLALQAAVASRLPLREALGAPLRDLLGTRYGAIWLVRVALLGALAGLLFMPRVDWRRGRPWIAGLFLGAGLLLTTSLSSHGAASGQSELPGWAHSALGGHEVHAMLLVVAGAVAFALSRRREPALWEVGAFIVATLASLICVQLLGLPVVLDWLHLFSMSLWVGGLVTLLLVVPRALRTAEHSQREAFLRALIPRFSQLALPCVAVLILTGIYATWFQVRHVTTLTGTAYGLSLLAKLALFLPLVLLGAANWYLGSERLQRLAPRLRPRVPGAIARRFSQAVRVEVVLVCLVLLATGVLTSLSPAVEAESTVAAPVAAFTATESTEEGSLTLAVDPAVAGANSIDVQLVEGDRPVTDASKVAVRFSMESEGIGESEAIAKASGDGHYTLSGPYMGVPGAWKVEVVARRPGHDDARAVFSVPVAAPRAAEAAGVRVELRAVPVMPRAGEGTQLQLLVTSTAGEPLSAAKVALTLLMPAHAHYEDVTLRQLGEGRYATDAQLQMSGEWVAQVTVDRAGTPPASLNIEFDVKE